MILYYIHNWLWFVEVEIFVHAICYDVIVNLFAYMSALCQILIFTYVVFYSMGVVSGYTLRIIIRLIDGSCIKL